MNDEVSGPTATATRPEGHAAFPPHLHAGLLEALAKRGFTSPTTVQQAVVDEAHGEHDLLVTSQTGSGKTVAFGLSASRALVAALAGKPRLSVERRRAPLVLVVAPTRELALQVQRELGWLYAPLGARVASCVGGVDFFKERNALDAGVHVVVGTPGRLVDHVTRKSLDLSTVACVVLDEADEMLKMGFREELEAILAACPPSPPEGARRTLLFSATLPADIVSLAKKVQHQAKRITATHTAAHQDIEVKAHLVDASEREAAVVNVLRFYEPARALVFVALRETVTRLAARLSERGFSAVALSGELSQAERTRALSSLREGRSRVLVCTDVAARGLDLPDVSLVVHADVANDPVSMTHRNGRTGRAGRKGLAVILAVPHKQRTAEIQLLSIGARTPWTALPSEADIRAADRARLAARTADDVAVLADDDRAFGAELLGAWGAENVAALLARTLRESLPQPEEVERSLALAPRARSARRPGEFAPSGGRGAAHAPPPRNTDHRGAPSRNEDRFAPRHTTDDRREPREHDEPRSSGRPIAPPVTRRDEAPPAAAPRQRVESEARQPPRREDRGPPRTRDDRGPPRTRDDRGPPRTRDDRGPPRARDDRGPPRARDDRGPPRARDDRGPPRARDDRGPPRARDDRGPPRPREERGPQASREKARRAPGSDGGGTRPPRKR
jgi:ATP-dependent RNA helicase DeaD